MPDNGDWWLGRVSIPATAQVLDFVLSDSDRRAWDNNKNRDYHVPIKNALTKEKLIQVPFSLWNPSPLPLRAMTCPAPAINSNLMSCIIYNSADSSINCHSSFPGFVNQQGPTPLHKLGFRSPVSKSALCFSIDVVLTESLPDQLYGTRSSTQQIAQLSTAGLILSHQMLKG